MDFSAHPVGIEFQLFDTPHVVALALVALANLAVMRFSHRRTPVARRAVRMSLAMLIVTAFVAYQLWRLTAGLWDVRTDLPLHLCDVMAVTSVTLLLTRHSGLYDFVYFLGIGGALQALLTSNVGIYGYPHLYFLSSMTAHGAVVTAGVYCAAVDGYQPTWRSLWRVTGWGIAYAVLIFFVNLWLGSNYLFIGRKPEFPSLIDYLGPWPWYVLALVGIGIVILHLLYLPFALRRLHRTNG